ncbi:MAG: hypothetical protein KQ78_00459 [Candidatus Izimaplasma bacterium HR2]|nr:MAG: hypothetical protein KQ78_00459 [Candidatus Izimaplasma bacterium HR2]
MIDSETRKHIKIFEKSYKKNMPKWMNFPPKISKQDVHNRILEIKIHIKFLNKLIYCSYWYMMMMTVSIQILSIILSFFIMGDVPPMSYTNSCTSIVFFGCFLKAFLIIRIRKMRGLKAIYHEVVY